MEIRPLPGPFGASVEGLDIAAGIDDATLRALMDALFNHQILVLRGQEADKRAYVEFGRRWGRPIDFFARQTLQSEFPDLIHVDNDPAVPPGKRNGAQHWHSDSTFDQEPALVTMLYGIDTPEEGGETLVASTRFAYDALPAAMRDRCDSLTALHIISGAPRLDGETFVAKAKEIPGMDVRRRPLVSVHPVNGVRALGPSGSAFGIAEMEEEEGHEFIREIRRHMTQPQFVTSYKIMPGEIFIWDNFQTVHSATPIEYSAQEGKRRLLYRISTKGRPPIYDIAA